MKGRLKVFVRKSFQWDAYAHVILRELEDRKGICGGALIRESIGQRNEWWFDGCLNYEWDII